jgi:hypothetical protein
MIESSNWIWGELGGSDKGGNWITNGALADKLYSLSRNKNEFSWTKKIVDDCKNRIKYSIEELDLEESVDDLFEIFVSTKMPEKWIENRKKINKKRK